MSAPNSVTDEVIREIGEQVSRTLVRKHPKLKGLDLYSGIGMYENHLRTYSNLEDIRHNEDGSLHKKKDGQVHPKVQGNSFEELDAHERRREGKQVYTTDELAKLKEANPDDTLFKENPDLIRRELAKKNHPQTDVVEIRPDGEIVTYQHKKYADVDDGVKGFLKDSDNDHFVVQADQYQDYVAKLDTKIREGGPEVERLKKIKEGLQQSAVTSDQAESPRKTVLGKAVGNAGKRTAGNVAVGVASDVAVFAFGGAVSEIRAAYRSPGELTLMERCERLLRAIWERLRAVLKDRSLREIGSEVVLAIVSGLARPLKLAQSAIEKIVDVLRRLWMDFVSGRLKTVAEVVSAALRAVYTVASIGVAILVEETLAGYLQIPGGDLLAALIAATVAAVMIVVGNRSIEAVVESVAALMAAGALARRRREEIERICNQAIPGLVADRERLVARLDRHFADREAFLHSTFEGLKSSRERQDLEGFVEELRKVNEVYGRAMPWQSAEEIHQSILDDSESLRL